jgi:uncharacterized protein
MWQHNLFAFAQRFLHPAWGIGHSQRVFRMATRLAGAQWEQVDRHALLAAAYLHDMGAFEPYREPGVDHAERSAQLLAEPLVEARFPREKIPLVQEITRGHMFYAEPGPSREAILFHDADTLDFLGTIGATRVLSIVELDDWTPDLRTAVELIERFSRELPGSLRTPKAREIGRVRVTEMRGFLATLGDETDLMALL